MPAYRPICRADEFPPGSARGVTIDGKPIGLFRVGERFWAMEDTCLHAGGPLHEGTLEGSIIVCPWHQWRFDVTDGSCGLSPHHHLAVYRTRIRDGVVEIEV